MPYLELCDQTTLCVAMIQLSKCEVVLGQALSTDADLSVTKSDSPDPVIAGETLTYTMAIHNDGPSTATGVVLTDTLPLSVTFVSAASSQGSCIESSGVVTCQLGTIGSGIDATVDIIVTVDPALRSPLFNSVTVSSVETDTQSGNNTASAVTTVHAAADLSVTKSDNPDPVSAGELLTYTLVVHNNGPSDATGVVLQDTLPAEVTYQSDLDNCTHSAGTVTCNMGTIGSGSNSVVSITVSVNPATRGQITNTVSVSGVEDDTQSGNNTASEVTTVNGEADLSIVKGDDPDPVIIGGTLTYTLVAHNNGPSNATGVTVYDTLPGNVVYQSSSSGCLHNGGTVTCTLGTIAPTSIVTASIVVTVSSSAGAQILNRASITGVETDPVSSNDTNSERTTVNRPVVDFYHGVYSVTTLEKHRKTFLTRLMAYSDTRYGPRRTLMSC